MTRRLEPRIAALETQVAVTDTVAVLVGQPTEVEVGRLHAAGVETIITIPRNGRETGGDPWRRSKSG